MRKRSTKKVDLLKGVELFSKCSVRQLEEIAMIADAVVVPSGYTLTMEGRPGREFFVIAEGEASVNVDGQEVARIGPGSFFGEMALLDRGPRTATVIAETELTAYVVDSRSFATLIDRTPSVAKAVMEGLSLRLREAEVPESLAVMAATR